MRVLTLLALLLFVAGCISTETGNKTQEVPESNATPIYGGCVTPDDCNGLVHIMCVGQWQCNKGKCSWECTGTQQNQPTPTPKTIVPISKVLNLTSVMVPTSQTKITHTTYQFPNCKVDLIESNAPCSPRITEGAGYVNATWCAGEVTFQLSAKCPGQTLESIKYSLFTQEQQTSPFNATIYLPIKLTTFTEKVEEQNEIGALTFGYTTHGEYPELQNITSLEGERVFCSNQDCTEAFILLDTPAKYLLVKTDTPSTTLGVITRLILDNPGRVYSPNVTDALTHLGWTYAYNRAASICTNAFGLIRAESVVFDWERDLIFSHREWGTKVLYPFDFFLDRTFWDSPVAIGAQTDKLTEFSVTRALGDKYSLCTADMSTCSPACANGNSFVVGNCESLSDVPLATELNGIWRKFTEITPGSSFNDMDCMTLLDKLGEDTVAYSMGTGKGMALMRPQSEHGLTLMAFKGKVGRELLNEILNKKYGFEFSLSTAKIGDPCTLYSYGQGYATVCNFQTLSVIGYNSCNNRDVCRPEIEWIIQKLS